MKIPLQESLNDDGADIYNRQGDHKDSPYFYSADFYNMESTDTRYIIPKFKTFQQSSWWSCGQASILMVLEYYGVLSDWNERNLADFRTIHQSHKTGSCTDQMIEIIEAVGGFDIITTYDYADKLDEINMAFFKEQIKLGNPIIVGWNDWGGHWQVVIGYDTMGTEYDGDDVIIVADSFDTSDHNQDGYGVYGAARFYENFTFYDFFPDDHLSDKCFIIMKPQT